MIKVDRRAFLGTLGTASAISAMSHEARAEALESYMIRQLDSDEADGSDATAEHVLSAEDPHGLNHSGAHQRLAHAAHQPSHPGFRVLLQLRIQRHQPAGQHQPPDRAVDEQRVRLSKV